VDASSGTGLMGVVALESGVEVRVLIYLSGRRQRWKTLVTIEVVEGR
jgi:hypothetical protein